MKQQKNQAGIPTRNECVLAEKQLLAQFTSVSSSLIIVLIALSVSLAVAGCEADKPPLPQLQSQVCGSIEGLACSAGQCCDLSVGQSR